VPSVEQLSQTVQFADQIVTQILGQGLIAYAFAHLHMGSYGRGAHEELGCVSLRHQVRIIGGKDDVLLAKHCSTRHQNTRTRSRAQRAQDVQ